MKDSLGDRIKGYEAVTKYTLMRRSYTIMRLDGVGFSKYTAKLQEPYDKGFVEDMIETTQYLCQEIQGARLGYTQSDEITIVITDFDTYETQPWYGNELQKMVSIAASKATAKFNQLRLIRFLEDGGAGGFDAIGSLKLATFDARVFQVPTLAEVNNVLIWRQRDFMRNSVSVCAQAKDMYSHNDVKGLTTNQKQELIFQKGSHLKEKLINCGYDNNTTGVPCMNTFAHSKDNFNWNDLPPNLKRGTTVTLKEVEKTNPSGEKYFRNVWMPEPSEFSSESVSLLPILDNSKL